jgi:ribosomal protein L18
MELAVAFDRGGFKHGAKATADAARKGGLKF